MLYNTESAWTRNLSITRKVPFPGDKGEVRARPGKRKKTRLLSPIDKIRGKKKAPLGRDGKAQRLGGRGLLKFKGSGLETRKPRTGKGTSGERKEHFFLWREATISPWQKLDQEGSL